MQNSPVAGDTRVGGRAHGGQWAGVGLCSLPREDQQGAGLGCGGGERSGEVCLWGQMRSLWEQRGRRRRILPHSLVIEAWTTGFGWGYSIAAR